MRSVSAGGPAIRRGHCGPTVEDVVAVVVSVPAGNPLGVGQVGADLPKRDHRVPLHRRTAIAAARLDEPTGPTEQQVGRPPDHRVGRVLQKQHTGARPRRPPDAVDVDGVDGFGEPHGSTAVVARLHFGGAGIAPHEQRVPQRALLRRPDPEHRVEAHPANVGQPPERGLAGQGPQALAVEHQLRPVVRRQFRPAVVDGVDQHPAGVHRLLPVGQKRNPARQIGVLQTDDRGVAVVHHLQRIRGHRVDPAGAGGRRDHQDLAARARRCARAH